MQAGGWAVITFVDPDLFELIGLESLLAHARWCDVEMISIVVADRDVTVTTGDPIATVGFYKYITYGF
jgi:hypothetical protein